MKKFMSNEPLLYINQPAIKKPKSYMQAEFMSEQNRNQENDKKHIKKKKEEAQTKSFQNLSLEDRVNYLVNMRGRQLPLKCKFRTMDKTYYGTVLNRDATTVDIVHSGRQKVTLNISDLEAINLIGL